MGFLAFLGLTLPELKTDLALVFCFLTIVCLPVGLFIACCNHARKGKMDLMPSKRK